MKIPYDPKNPLSDFRNFLCLCWAHLNLPRPSRRQLAIAYFLQFGPTRRVIQAFRGVGKSWITSAFVVWLLFMNPGLNIVVVSASKTRADNFTTFCLRLINDIPELQHLRPSDTQRNSRVAFDVGPAPASHTPSVVSIGITGQLTGNRADVLVADDVEVPSNSATMMMREKLSEAVKEFDAVLKPGGEIVYLGTPQTEDSLYRLLPARDYTVRIWPARYPTEGQRHAYADTLAPDIIEDMDHGAPVGGTTEPRFSDLDLASREISYGKAGFSLQFMLDPTFSDVDRYPLKLKDLAVTNLSNGLAPERVVWVSSPEQVINDLTNMGIRDRWIRPLHQPGTLYLPYTGVVMAIDPSGRGKDETAYAVVGYLHGNLFLLDAGGFADGYAPETLEALAYTAKAYGVKYIVAESNFGGGMFESLLKPVLGRIYPCTVEGIRHNVQKEKRICDTLEPVMASHRLVVDRAVVEKDAQTIRNDENASPYRYQLFYQMTRITRDRGALVQDDRLDALAMAVAYWVESMARDTEKAAEHSKSKLMDQELKNFAKHVFGKEVKTRWKVRI